MYVIIKIKKGKRSIGLRFLRFSLSFPTMAFSYNIILLLNLKNKSSVKIIDLVQFTHTHTHTYIPMRINRVEFFNSLAVKLIEFRFRKRPGDFHGDNKYSPFLPRNAFQLKTLK